MTPLIALSATVLYLVGVGWLWAQMIRRRDALSRWHLRRHGYRSPYHNCPEHKLRGLGDGRATCRACVRVDVKACADCDIAKFGIGIGILTWPASWAPVIAFLTVFGFVVRVRNHVLSHTKPVVINAPVSLDDLEREVLGPPES